MKRHKNVSKYTPDETIPSSIQGFNYLIGSEDIFRSLLHACIGNKYILGKLGKYKLSFGKKANRAFANIGKDVLGDNKVLIDNLWFVGHFYHDGPNCKIREGAKIVDFPYLEDIELPRLCPFLGYGCVKSS